MIVGESVNFRGGIDWLEESGVEVVDLASKECIEMLSSWIRDNPRLWAEDIGEDGE